MKTLTTLTALIALIAMLFTTSCQKDVAPQNTISKKALMGAYKVTATVMKGNNGAEKEVFTTIPDCQKETCQILKANSGYELLNACDPAGNQTSSWNLVSANKVTINGLTGDIVSFNGRSLGAFFSQLFRATCNNG